MNIKEEKQKLRKECLVLLRNQDPAVRLKKSRTIINKVLGLKTLETSKNIMLYVSDEYEVETKSFIRELLASGKKVIIPLVDEMRNIIPIEINSLDTDTHMNTLGIFEPKEVCAKHPFAIDDLDVVFVPGVSFDHAHNRLGRGWACYDRFLQRLDVSIPTYGLAFDFQLRSHIPTETTDVAMTEIIVNE